MTRMSGIQTNGKGRKTLYDRHAEQPGGGGNNFVAQAAAEALFTKTNSLEGYTFEGLVKLHSEIADEIEARRSKEIEALRARTEAAAAALGIEGYELFSRPAKVRRHIRPAKYRGPKGEEWHGIGMRPQWLKQYLADGHELAEYRINSL